MSCGREVKDGVECGNSPHLLRIHSEPQRCAKDDFKRKTLESQQVQKAAFSELPSSD